MLGMKDFALYTITSEKNLKRYMCVCVRVCVRVFVCVYVCGCLSVLACLLVCYKYTSIGFIIMLGMKDFALYMCTITSEVNLKFCKNRTYTQTSRDIALAHIPIYTYIVIETAWKAQNCMNYRLGIRGCGVVSVLDFSLP